jgi:mannitol/fructose-specific phosphotransferase system IIA component (Ntr-type)
MKLLLVISQPPLSVSQMLLAIALSLSLVMFIEILARTVRASSRKPQLSRAMVGVPEIHALTSDTREGAIRELIAVAARVLRSPPEHVLLKGVMRREGQMATGLVHGIAVPHARFARLDRSLVLFARSAKGIEWECFDGAPAKLIFLIISPEDDEHAQLKMLAEIGRCADSPDCLEILNAARDCRAVTRAIERVNKPRSRE